jgi:hypothetical protein
MKATKSKLRLIPLMTLGLIVINVLAWHRLEKMC